MEGKMEAEIYTVNQAAEFLKISRVAVYRLIHSRKINARVIGNGWRILKGELVRYVKEG